MNQGSVGFQGVCFLWKVLCMPGGKSVIFHTIAALCEDDSAGGKKTSQWGASMGRTVHPRSLTYPLKNGGWKTTFLLGT